MPSYQAGTGVVENTYSSGAPCGAPSAAYCREVPDVSADADPNTGYLIYWTSAAGGSSAGPAPPRRCGPA